MKEREERKKKEEGRKDIWSLFSFHVIVTHTHGRLHKHICSYEFSVALFTFFLKDIKFYFPSNSPTRSTVVK